MFTADDFRTEGVERYGEDILRNRMRGALADTGDADEELLEIADSVYNRVRTAAKRTIGWPFPGTDDAGNLYQDKWPGNILQKALELFNWRTLSGQEVISTDERRIGEAAEKFFDDLEKGILSWGIAGDTDLVPGTMLAARERNGVALIDNLLSPTTPNLLDNFRGLGWDS